MKYRIIEDIKIVKTILNLTNSQLANELNVARSTITRIINGAVNPSDLFLETFYSFAYKNAYKRIKLNELKIQFAFDQFDKVLFHGAKNELSEHIDLNHSRDNIDLGKGFYLGENFEQASSYVFANLKASVYIFDCRKLAQLKIKEFNVSLEWMVAVCYYRNQIDKYKDSSFVKAIINDIESSDVVIAPIADNNMYEIMNQFSRGEITDLQAMMALSASHLGKQHVLKTIKACKSIFMVERLYLCKEEREDIKNKQQENASIAKDKTKIVIETNRRKGKYIEELLK